MSRRVPLPIRLCSTLFIKFLGWKITGNFDDMEKCVIVSQHTSNWDGIITIFGAFSLGIRPRWIGKKKLFWGPMGVIMRWAGGLEVDRAKRSNIVEQVAARFSQEDHLWLFIAPEGTRQKAEYWKSGFYHIAQKAHVPIVHGYLDYAEHKVGVGDRLQPSGDIHADMEIIQSWFTHTRPKYPQNAAEIRLQDMDSMR